MAINNTSNMKIDTPQLKRLRELVVDLNVQWQMLDELFSDPKNYAVFNRTGPSFWIHLQTYLLDTVFLSISRFFDPAKSLNHTNFSLATVIELKEVAPIKRDLELRLSKMRPTWEKGIKLWRHKKLSHSDMPTVMAEESLPDIPHSEVKVLVSDISEFVREIDHLLNHVDVNYRVSVSQWVPQVMRYLETGIQKTDTDRKDA
jgi:AbiU2